MGPTGSYRQSSAHSCIVVIWSNSVTAGVQLLPESYAVLIYAAMESSPPDLEMAKTLYTIVLGTETDPQLPWATFCRLLAARGFAADAVATVRDGLKAGRVLDSSVAEAYLKGLCDTQQLVSGGSEVGWMLAGAVAVVSLAGVLRPGALGEAVVGDVPP